MGPIRSSLIAHMALPGAVIGSGHPAIPEFLVYDLMLRICPGDLWIPPAALGIPIDEIVARLGKGDVFARRYRIVESRSQGLDVVTGIRPIYPDTLNLVESIDPCLHRVEAPERKLKLSYADIHPKFSGFSY